MLNQEKIDSDLKSSKKETEEFLLLSNQQFNQLFNNMIDGVVLLQLVYNDQNQAVDYIFINVNKAYESIVSCKSIDRIGKTGTECYGKPLLLETIQKVALTGKPQTYEFFHKSINKHIQSSAFSLGADKVGVIFSDITERRRVENDLKETLKKTRLLIDHAPTAIYEIDLINNKFIKVNEVMCHYLGYSLEELLTLSPFDILTPESAELYKTRLNKQLKGEITETNVDYKIKTKDNRELYTSLNSTFTYKNGKPVKAFVVAHDITAIKEIEHKHRDFLAILGHELRNPLASILLLLDLIEPKIKQDIQLIETLNKLKHQARNMSDLVKDLLDISRIEMGKIELHKKTIDIVQTVRNAIDAIKPLLEKNNQSLEMTMPNNEVPVMADHLRLEQVISNILHNASKFSPQNSTIRLVLEVTEKDVKITIKDYGDGFSKDSIERIFNLFVQNNNGSKENNDGLGIGLYLSLQLMRLHGGDIAVYSQGVGKGSEFVIKIPINNKKTTSLQKKKKKQLPDKIKVLVVDDNIVLADTLESAIASLGYVVKKCNDGKTALETIKEFKPNIALIDLGLPIMDGLTLAKEIRTNQDIVRPRLIAITGYGQENDKKIAREIGFDDYIIKPINMSDLKKIFLKQKLNLPAN